MSLLNILPFFSFSLSNLSPANPPPLLIINPTNLQQTLQEPLFFLLELEPIHLNLAPILIHELQHQLIPLGVFDPHEDVDGVSFCVGLLERVGHEG